MLDEEMEVSAAYFTQHLAILSHFRRKPVSPRVAGFIRKVHLANPIFSAPWDLQSRGPIAGFVILKSKTFYLKCSSTATLTSASNTGQCPWKH
jgi:hypothetical protein